MNRDQKAVAIAEIATHIDESDAIFAVDYRGITVAQVAELRAKLRESDATFKVVKNSLTERAADQVGAETLKEFLSGPTALTFVRGDVATAAKAVADYARATQLLPFKGGLMDGAHARRRADPLALAPALARSALRPARRRRRLARLRARAHAQRAARRARRRARPGAAPRRSPGRSPPASPAAGDALRAAPPQPAAEADRRRLTRAEAEAGRRRRARQALTRRRGERCRSEVAPRPRTTAAEPPATTQPETEPEAGRAGASRRQPGGRLG